MIAQLTTALVVLCPHVPRHELLQDATQIVGYAAAYEFDPVMAAAVMVRESTCRRDAKNKVTGALGLMGLMHPSDLEREDYVANIRGGVLLLAQYRRRCTGDLRRALTAYNRGPGSRARNCRASTYSAEVLAIEAQIIERVRVEVASR